MDNKKNEAEDDEVRENTENGNDDSFCQLFKHDCQ
jgi:hypothetical protein